ncbi:hypothetical protein PIB30_047183 [Stylosanthes scabra]|uniref:Uncharacterized protein n=1 Tax=Stylosanthes scabra TaxID=79078 RepID=A0ABU6QHD5_9FABA|nr:hypothetical protein [Stylosanthes scabra]
MKENAETDNSSKKKVAEPEAKGKEKVDEAKGVETGKSPKKIIYGKKTRGGAGAKKRQYDGPSGLHGGSVAAASDSFTATSASPKVVTSDLTKSNVAGQAQSPIGLLGLVTPLPSG